MHQKQFRRHRPSKLQNDFSDLIFSNSSEVNSVYDTIERLIEKTDRKWYFMISYRDTIIGPDAWFQYAMRDKIINKASSLDSVRFDFREPTRAEIIKRTVSDDYNSTLPSTRDEAIERVFMMKREFA